MKIWIFVVLSLIAFAFLTGIHAADDEDIPSCRPCHKGITPASKECDCPAKFIKEAKQFKGLGGVMKDGFCCNEDV